MNRIDLKFKELKANGEKAFVAFTTYGYPTIEDSDEILNIFKNENVDIIEIGIPFSDPLADGIVLQEASHEALKNGTNIHKVFDGVEKFRRNSQCPIVFLTYFNAVYVYGIKNFADKCGTVGVDGIVIPDLPLEERKEVEDIFGKRGISLIAMVTPTSKNRISSLVNNSSGFIYCVSSKGVTGGKENFDSDIRILREHVSLHTDTPLVMGFGIRNAENIRMYKNEFDGFIIGSEIIRKIAESDGEDDFKDLQIFVKSISEEAHNKK